MLSRASIGVLFAERSGIFDQSFTTMRPLAAIPFFFSTFILMAQSPTFTLTSSDLGGQATSREVYNGFGCTGENISPQLAWSNTPTGTKSYAITLYDPDAPTGSGWWHWVVFDIPAYVKELPAGAGTPGKPGLPEGAIQSMTDYGVPGYGGPCPPEGHGPHRYILTIHALDVDKLGLDANAGAPLAGFNIGAHTLAKASLIFYHER
jgi:Raf kinase inhibitor-like YbhB/YbcL family protein